MSILLLTTQTGFLVRSGSVEDGRVLLRAQRPFEVLIDRGIADATRRPDAGPLSTRGRARRRRRHGRVVDCDI